MSSINLLIKPASSLCNLRCKYCFYNDVAENRQVHSYAMMDEATLECLVKRAFEYSLDLAGFIFQGGEPTLAGLDFYKKLIELINKYNVNNVKVTKSIQTNGYLINDEWAKFFFDNDFLVGLSIDGTKQAHDSLRVDANGKGTFERVSATARLFERYGVRFNVLCVVNNFVARHPKKVYEQLKKYRYIQLIACLDAFDGAKQVYSLSEERYGEFLKQIFDAYYSDLMNGNYVSIRNFDNYVNIMLNHPPESCAMNGACTCYGVVEGDGSVYPCDFYVLDKWKLGNVHDNGFKEMLHGDVAKEFVLASVTVPEECKACKYYFLCRGGCRRERQVLGDNSIGKNIHCTAYKAFFEYSTDKLWEIARNISVK